MELKRILKQYLFSLVIILCIGLFFYGTVLAAERTRYNMDMTEYETVELKNTDGGVLLRYGNNEWIISSDYAQKLIKKLNIDIDENFLFEFQHILN